MIFTGMYINSRYLINNNKNMKNIIKLESKCTASTLSTLKDDLLDGALNGVNVELDFSSVESPDMRSIQLLMAWSKSVQSEGGSVKSSGVSENLNRFLAMTGTDSLAV